MVEKSWGTYTVTRKLKIRDEVDGVRVVWPAESLRNFLREVPEDALVWLDQREIYVEWEVPL